MPTSINRCLLAPLTSTAALLIGALALAPPAGASTLYACVGKNGDARIFHKKPRCKKRESRLSWNSSGPAAKNGLNGANGAPGRDGAAGKDGFNGKDGIAGKNGINGRDGANGEDGANGAVGGFAAALAGGEAVPYTTATEGSPATILSKTLPAGNFIASGKVELVYTDTKAGAAAASVCKLIDIPAGGGATSSDTSSWASLVNVPFVTFVFSQATIPFWLAVNSPSHPSTLTVACYLKLKEAAGGALSAEASNAAITAVQTTVNG